MEKKNIAVFGSAFNPPTLGHASVLQRLVHFDLVLLVPSFAHAWGKTMAPFESRCQWLQLFVDELGLRNLQICQIESQLAETRDTVTTFELLKALSAQYPNDSLTFVMGPDNLLNFNKFSNYQNILNQWNVLTCPQTHNIRSTQIREALKMGKSIDYLTTPRLSQRLQESDFMPL